MLNTGFKIVNAPNERILIKELLNYFRYNGQYLAEIGFYYKINSLNILFEEYCKNEFIRINTHNNHKNSVISLYHGSANIIEELKLAKSLNSNYSIIHLTESKEIEDLFNKKELIIKSLPLLETLNQIALQYNYHFYLENTYHGISFYKELFDLIKVKNLQNIHFCFDIGHAKVWSGNNLHEWYEFMDYLKSKAIRLHFHLHLNDGNADDHLSFMESNHTGGDKFSGYINYEDIIRSLIYRFPHERKIFEVKTKFAVPNIQYVNRLLRRERLVS